MRLSESFDDEDCSLELIVTAFNINYGLNPPILKKCRYLNDYSTLVGQVKSGIASGLSRRDAIIQAVKICMDKGIMKGYLETHAEEVFSMLALEWDMNEALAARREDGFEEGLAEGLNKGMIKGTENVAVKMLNKGKSLEEIQEMTDIPVERIKEIAASMNISFND